MASASRSVNQGSTERVEASTVCGGDGMAAVRRRMSSSTKRIDVQAARVYLVHLQGCIAGDTDLEQSCAEVSRLLTARVLESDDASLNPKAKKEKRPPEPPIDLVLLRKYELDAMLKQGKSEAYAANLTAGYFGGNGKLAQLTWWCAGLLFMTLTVYLLVQQPAYDSFWVLGSICTGCICTSTVVRAYYLRRRPHIAHIALVASLFSVAVTLMCFMPAAITEMGEQVYNFTPRAAAPLTPSNGGRGGGADSFPMLGEAVSMPKSIVMLQFLCIFMGLGNLLLVGLLLAQRRKTAQNVLIGIFLCGCILDVGCGILLWFPPYGVPWLSAAVFGVAALLLAPTIIVPVVRMKQMSAADKLVVEDARQYDEAWQLTVQPENASALQALEARVKRWKHEGATHSRLGRKVHNELLSASKAALTDKPRQTIRDLGVLFGQAAALNPHFQSIVRQWSAGLGVHQPTTPVKRRARAIEKLFRMYRGDSGCLIDLVRASVTFNSFEEMMECLQRILSDKRAVVLQIKNRFAFDYDSAASAGYRNLAISFVLVDQFTMQHAIDKHVTELQFGLATIDTMKHDMNGHDSYVAWRNARAE